MGFQFRSSLAALFALTAQAALELAAAQDAQLPRLYTNEIAIEDATRTTALGIDDPVAVFAFIFGALPDRVRVYPTENYFYFSFFHNGTRYAGNIRLAAVDRDNGKLHFEYYQDIVEWMGKGRAHHAVLDASQGVTVERVERLVYRVSRESKSVIFALEDLSGVKPPANAIGPQEEFIGPVADESAIRFFLVYNWRLKIFHYVLDETSAVALLSTFSIRRGWRPSSTYLPCSASSRWHRKHSGYPPPIRHSTLTRNPKPNDRRRTT